MTTSKQQAVTRKIGVNKGKRRIWLEGKVLTNAGINHGQRFNIIQSDNMLSIIIDPAGERKIAGGPNRPIIDMSAATITNSFTDDVAAVTVTQSSLGLILMGIK
jgi:DNA (cytosine-5)-methyltransferase 1